MSFYASVFDANGPQIMAFSDMPADQYPLGAGDRAVARLAQGVAAPGCLTALSVAG
jgi:hypothetical protein